MVERVLQVKEVAETMSMLNQDQRRGRLISPLSADFSKGKADDHASRNIAYE